MIEDIPPASSPAPPPEVPLHPDFDPERMNENNLPVILGVITTLHFLAVFIVVLRFYVRARIVHNLGWDDWVMGAATLCALGGWIIFVLQGSWGLGHHSWALTYDQAVKIEQGSFWMSIISSAAGIAFLKVSVALTLLRFSPGYWYTCCLRAGIVFVIAYSIMGMLTFLLHCSPMEGHWNPMMMADCYPLDLFLTFAILNSALNIFTDVLFATFPIPMIWTLRMRRRSRLYLIGVLSLGYIAAIIGVLKSVAQINFDAFADNYFNSWITFWAGVQINVGIIAACVPSLKPMLNKALRLTSCARSDCDENSRGSDLQTIGGSGKSARRYSQYGMEELGNSEGGGSEVHLGVKGQNIATAAFYLQSEEEERSRYDMKRQGLSEGHGMRGIIRTTEVIVK